jgi:hypothetical protein
VTVKVKIFWRRSESENNFVEVKVKIFWCQSECENENIFAKAEVKIFYDSEKVIIFLLSCDEIFSRVPASNAQVWFHDSKAVGRSHSSSQKE